MALIVGLLTATCCLILAGMFVASLFAGDDEPTYVEVHHHHDEITWEFPPRWQDTAHVSHSGKARVGL